jgi:hypothetical protein
MHISIRRLCLPLLAALTGCLVNSATGPDLPVYPVGTTRVLFIGNSLTSVGDVPSRVVQIARQWGDTSVRVSTLAAPNFALIDHWSTGNVQSILSRSDWEFVVMQQGPSSLPENQVLLREWSALIEPSIRAARGMPVLYGVWPQQSRPQDMPAVEQSYRLAAQAIRGEFAPAGSAWYRALSLNPALPLYSADGLHAAPMGAYLAALVIASRILGRDPLTLPPVAPGVAADSATVRLLQRVASETLRDLDVTPSTGPLRADAPVAARIAWGEAMAAQRKGALDSALRLAVRASDTWPMQPAYAAGVIRLATQQGDTAAQRHAESRLRHLTLPPAPERSRAVVVSPDTTVFPEGLAADPSTGRLFVTSLAHRTVYRTSPDGQWSRFLSLDRLDAASPVAIVVDSARRELVVATSVVAEAGTPTGAHGSELIVARLDDGAVTQRTPLGDGTVMPGEITLLPDGDLAVSDARRGAILVRSRATGVTRQYTHPWLRSPQGMVATRDGRRLVIADWSTGLLLLTRETGEVIRLQEPAGGSTLGIDGLTRAQSAEDDVLIGVQNGLGAPRIVRIVLGADDARIMAFEEIDRPAVVRGESTIGVMMNGVYWYVSSSHWPFRDDAGKRVAAESPLPSVELRRLEIP